MSTIEERAKSDAVADPHEHLSPIPTPVPTPFAWRRPHFRHRTLIPTSTL